MSIFSFVKSQISIFDVVGEYTMLKKAGLYWKATCPFHSEKDASFTVSPHKEIFYCFGCHVGGDVITFIEKIEQCSPLEAAHFLVERYHLKIPSDIKWEKSGSSFEEKEHYFKLCSVVTQWAHEALLKTHDALKYLGKRGINQSGIDSYMLGYFPGGQQGINSLLKAIKKRHIMPHDLIEVRIVAESKGYIYSPFEERIIFPIRDHLGRYCGFGGRVFKMHDERAKYYNSSENGYFQKGKLIFGLDLAKHTIQKIGQAFLVEGYTDCIAMRQHGFTNNVSTLGTACTSDHLQTLSRYCDRIFILYDGDIAGRQAILRLAELCWNSSLELNVISLPAGEDPASFLAKGSDLKELVDKSQGIFEFFLASVGKDFQVQSLAEKVVVVRKILGVIAAIGDCLKRTMLLQKAAAVFSIPYDSLQGELVILQRKSGQSCVGDVNNGIQQEGTALDKGMLRQTSRLEKKIFFAIMSNMQLFNSEDEGYLIGYFSEPLRSILEKLQKAKIEESTVDFRHFFDRLEKNEQQVVSGILLECNYEVESSNFEHLLDQFRCRSWKRVVRTIKAQMESNHDKSDLSSRLLNDLLVLRSRIFCKGRF